MTSKPFRLDGWTYTLDGRLIGTPEIDGVEFFDRSDIVNFNWKVYVDNYLDFSHIPVVHPGLMKELDYPRHCTEAFRYYSQQLRPVKELKPNDSAE